MEFDMMLAKYHPSCNSITSRGGQTDLTDDGGRGRGRAPELPIGHLARNRGSQSARANGKGRSRPPFLGREAESCSALIWRRFGFSVSAEFKRGGIGSSTGFDLDSGQDLNAVGRGRPGLTIGARARNKIAKGKKGERKLHVAIL